ncbi:oligopeptide ABC transporter permease OppC [Spiroplasma tabanidicola]|uniref:Oligopeptide ABC transporter permease n=1 Tax=Spiroplasma tabanidicola TaxID=324079 RepID=A0A6I6CCY1_9MOLU|nr:oligopeptide ABC transporter permease OppC [Spiroplasma tabanidicola]QGS52148.1 oligopeptide ABC transporter permease [Spiroplasma tabanidicola]
MEVILHNQKEIEISSIDASLFKFVEKREESIEKINSKPYSYWKSVSKLVLKSKVFIISSIILISFVLMAFIIGKNADISSVSSDPFHPESPSVKHWFGIGYNGEDLWNKMWLGSRKTIIFAFIISAIEISLGLVLGAIWGYYSKLDILFIEFIRFMTIIPSLILWLFIIFLFGGKADLFKIIVAISITSWIGLAETMRIQMILVRNSEYNVASQVLGTRGPRIIVKNILPKILPIIIQTISFSIPGAIGLDAALSYYSFGFIENYASDASLGTILNQALQSPYTLYPHLLYIPLSFIGVISLLFYFNGKIFADSLDPKLHR